MKSVFLKLGMSLSLLMSSYLWACISMYEQSMRVTVLSKGEGGYKVLLTQKRLKKNTNEKIGPTTRRVFFEDDGYLLLKILKKQAQNAESEGKEISPKVRKFTQNVARFYVEKLVKNKSTHLHITNGITNADKDNKLAKEYDDMVEEVKREIRNLNGTTSLVKTIEIIFKQTSVLEQTLAKAGAKHSYKDQNGKNIEEAQVLPVKLTRGLGGSCDGYKHQFALGDDSLLNDYATKTRVGNLRNKNKGTRRVD